MKKLTVSIFIFISACINTLSSFFFLIDSTINRSHTTNLLQYARIVNDLLFIGSLAFLVMAFYFKDTWKNAFGYSCIVLGLLNIILMMSYLSTNFYFLIPLLFFVVAGLFCITYNKPLYK